MKYYKYISGLSLSLLAACTAVPYTDIGYLNPGEACTQTYFCPAGYECSEGFCTAISDPDVNTYKGKSCDKHSDCCQDSEGDGNCINENGLYCGTQKRCTTTPGSGENAPCFLDVDCQAPLVCSGATSTCVKVIPGEKGNKDLGENCTALDDCRRPYLCSMMGITHTCEKLPFFKGAVCTASDRESGPYRFYYELPKTEDSASDEGTGEFYRHPFPSNVRLTKEGKVYLDDHPSPGEVLGVDVAAKYIESAKEVVSGYALNQPIFFRASDFFQKASICLDDGSIYPELADGDSDAYCENGGAPTVYLVNIDKKSTNYAQHRPVELRLVKPATQFTCQNLLGIAPLTGHPLEPATTYAAIITTGVHDAIHKSAPVQDTLFAAALNPTPEVPQKVVTANQPLKEYLADKNIDPATIAVAAVFTTGKPTEIGKKLYNAITKMTDVPKFNADAFSCENPPASYICHQGENAQVIASRSCGSSDTRFYEIHGTYKAPAFQTGYRPYLLTGGQINLNAQGEPQKYKDETMCYALTIPKDKDKPENGWPVIVYAHGTGGNYRSFVTDELVGIYTDLGFAVISFDNVMHGPRQDPSYDPSKWNPALWSLDNAGNLFFNPINPQASRDNILQGGADLISLTRLVASSHPSVDGLNISFDKDNIYYLGHSQGTTINGPFLVNDTITKGAILSGAGAELAISVLHKKKPIDLGGTMSNLLGDQNISRVNPIMGILSLLFAEVDTLSYASGFVTTPERQPRPLIMFSGIDDSYSPNEAQASQIQAMGVPLAGTVIRQIPDVPLTGDATLTTTTLNGQTIDVAAAAIQYQPEEESDGHFVLFKNDDAKEVLRHFLSTALSGHAEIKP